jgi:Ca-activated chloride channel family protein
MMPPVDRVRASRSDVVPFLSTLVVGALLIVGAHAVWPTDPCLTSQLSAQSVPRSGSDSIQLTVLSSSNKAAVMGEMACRFERSSPTVDDHPIDVVISSEASGSAYQNIGGDLRPVVWSPAATSWVSMLRQDHTDWIPESAPSIAQSPQVIAMPKPIGEALGWPSGQLGWRDIVDFATEPGAWKAVAQPGWGDFKLGKTNPRLSTSGLNSTVATFRVATGTASDLTLAQLHDHDVLTFVHAVESAAVHYAPTSIDFLRNLRVQDEQGNGEGYVSAILLEEKSVWDYDRGNPSGDPATLEDASPPDTPLVAFYPKEGALVADHPYVTLDGPWVSQDQRSAAAAFLAFLLAPRQQHRFQDLGYRDAYGVPGDQISIENGLIPTAPPTVMFPPGGDVLRAIRDSWPTYRKRARMLIVIDVSGSMTGVVPGTRRTKLELAKEAASEAITQLAPGDEVGLWTFSPASSSDPYVEEVPIAPMSTNALALRNAIAGLTADSGNRSELYSTVDAAVSALRAAYEPERINGVVLLSDGPNEGSANTDLNGLLHDVAPPQVDEEVRVFTIAYGDQSQADTLAGIAQTSLGTPYDATDPSDIRKVFYQVVANF